MLPLHYVLAADRQTKSLGDLEITLADDDNVITSYEMRKVTRENIDHVLQKISESSQRIDNYIITDVIDEEVAGYSLSIYEKTGGIEMAIQNCIGFIRHFLHLFYRVRT